MSTRRFALIGIAIVSIAACADADAGRSTGPTAPAAPVAAAPSMAMPSAADGSSAPLVILGVQAFDLGTLSGGTFSTARDINDGGDVVGWSETSSGEVRAFILTGSGMADIGTLGGDRSRAFAINDLGQVVGASRNALGVEHAFEWSGGTMRDLGAYPPEDDIGSSSAAYGINDLGLVAGNVDLSGVVWDLAGTPNFPPFPPYVRVTDPDPFTPAIAYDINDVGQAAGTLLAAAQGFRWQGSLEPLAVLGALDDDAFGVNELGQVVGRARPTGADTSPTRTGTDSRTSCSTSVPRTRGSGVATPRFP